MKSENWQSGQKVLKQDMQYAQTSVDSAITDRQSDNFTSGIAKDLLNGMIFLTGGTSTSITVATGVGYTPVGERVVIADQTVPYDDTKPSQTTPDGIGDNTLTPQSSGSANIPMASGVVNLLYIQYLGVINPLIFTLHKITKQKLFTEISDGYEIRVVNGGNVDPNTINIVTSAPSGGPWIFLGWVDYRTGGVISSSMFNISKRPLYEININRVQGVTPLADFSNITPSGNYGPNLPVTFDAHIKAIGSTAPTNRNPHGMTLQDIGFTGKTVEQHEEFLHAAGIANGDESPTAANSLNIAINPRCPETDEIIIYGLTPTQFLVMPAISGNTSVTLGSSDLPTTLLSFSTLPSGTYYIWVDSSLRKLVFGTTLPTFPYQFLIWTVVFTTTKGSTTIPGVYFLVPPSGPCAGTSNFSSIFDNRFFGNTGSQNLLVDLATDTFTIDHNVAISKSLTLQESSAPTPTAGEGILFFDTVTDKFQISEDGGPFHPLLATPGTLIQHKSTFNNSFISLGSFPTNDLVPTTSTSGTSILTFSFTPKSTTSTLRVRATAYIACDLSSGKTALFVSSISPTNAVAMGFASSAAPGPSFGNPFSTVPVVLQYEFISGTISPITFTVYAGGDGTNFLNGYVSSRVGGGTLASFLEVDEIAN